MMKKTLTLLMSLCLVLLVSTVSAEGIVSDGTPQVFDGFTLNLDSGMCYIRYNKELGKAYVTVYPYYATEGESTTFLWLSWVGGTDPFTTDEVSQVLTNMKENSPQIFTDAGYTVNSVQCADPIESTLADVPCLILESQTDLVDPNGDHFIYYFRLYHIWSIGFSATISSRNQDKFQSTCDFLDKVLVWQ